MKDVNMIRAWLAAQSQEITMEQVALCEIPAPSGYEGTRAEAMLRRFRDLGLDQVRIDEVGNVRGTWHGRDPSQLLILAAHLDTVFPPGTDVRVRRGEGGRLHAPGIGDNAAGLAALLALARTLRELNLIPQVDVLFFAPVGEEGRGDLRGTRHLFDTCAQRDRVCGFITLDCDRPGCLVTRAVGSHRYRLVFRGPGGHSFSDFGRPSALHAACRAVASMAGSSAAGFVNGTVNIGMFGNASCDGPAGTSINTIASEAAFEIDLRSTDERILDQLDIWLRQALDGALGDERAWATQRTGEIRYEVERLGRRPAGALAPDSRLRQAVIAAYNRLGISPSDGEGSTDANIPLSRGIPALAMWRGGSGGGVHTLSEWYDPTGRDLALAAIIELILHYP